MKASCQVVVMIGRVAATAAVAAARDIASRVPSARSVSCNTDVDQIG